MMGNFAWHFHHKQHEVAVLTPVDVAVPDVALPSDDEDIAANNHTYEKAHSDRERREVSIRYVELLLVHDSVRLADHGAIEVKQQGLAIVNIVDSLYQIGNRFKPQIRFVVKDQIVWRESDEPASLKGSKVDSSRVLQEFANYHQQNRIGQDAAVLITHRGS